MIITIFSVSRFCGNFFLVALRSALRISVVVSAAVMSFWRSWAFFSRSFLRFSIFLNSWIRYSSSATYRKENDKRLNALLLWWLCFETCWATVVWVLDIIWPAQVCGWTICPAALSCVSHGLRQICRSSALSLYLSEPLLTSRKCYDNVPWDPQQIVSTKMKQAVIAQISLNSNHEIEQI